MSGKRKPPRDTGALRDSLGPSPLRKAYRHWLLLEQMRRERELARPLWEKLFQNEWHDPDRPKEKPMTEAEWLTLDNPLPMLDYLLHPERGVRLPDSNEPLPYRGPHHLATDRKLRLFACACAKLGRGDASRPGGSIDQAEDFADGGSVQSGTWSSSLEPKDQLRTVAVLFQFGHRSAECADLLRDTIGNPFRPVTLPYEATWEELRQSVQGASMDTQPISRCPWLTETVVGMAQAAYEERAFDRLPILADALEEAGCTNADVLGHLRGPSPHARGCWVVDLILGKG